MNNVCPNKAPSIYINNHEVSRGLDVHQYGANVVLILSAMLNIRLLVDAYSYVVNRFGHRMCYMMLFVYFVHLKCACSTV